MGNNRVEIIGKKPALYWVFYIFSNTTIGLTSIFLTYLYFGLPILEFHLISWGLYGFSTGVIDIIFGLAVVIWVARFLRRYQSSRKVELALLIIPELVPWIATAGFLFWKGYNFSGLQLAFVIYLLLRYVFRGETLYEPHEPDMESSNLKVNNGSWKDASFTFFSLHTKYIFHNYSKVGVYFHMVFLPIIAILVALNQVALNTSIFFTIVASSAILLSSHEYIKQKGEKKEKEAEKHLLRSIGVDFSFKDFVDYVNRNRDSPQSSDRVNTLYNQLEEVSKILVTNETTKVAGPHQGQREVNIYGVTRALPDNLEYVLKMKDHDVGGKDGHLYQTYVEVLRDFTKQKVEQINIDTSEIPTSFLRSIITDMDDIFKYRGKVQNLNIDDEDFDDWEGAKSYFQNQVRLELLQAAINKGYGNNTEP